MNTVKEWADALKGSVGSAFFGKRDVVEKAIVALLCRGHVLIEDVPGTGKTVLARALANGVGGEFRQIQCTPDLLPADVLGVSIYNPGTGGFDFREGPIMANMVLVDEINRATPRTQSALLEAMAEGQVSVEGRSLPLPDPFFLIATESPVDSEGTFPLPEVQKDRFFLSLTLGYPDRESELGIMEMQRHPSPAAGNAATPCDVAVLRAMQQKTIEVHVEQSIRKYILAIVHATRSDARLFLGVSPRGSLALYKGAQALAALRGRDYAVPEDVQEIAPSVLRKRIVLKAEHASKGLVEDAVIRDVLGSIGVPPLADAV
jgi:MoxR-like ATPase